MDFSMGTGNLLGQFGLVMRDDDEEDGLTHEDEGMSDEDDGVAMVVEKADEEDLEEGEI